MVLTLGRLAALTRSPAVSSLIGFALVAWLMVYALRSFKRIYNERWWRIVPKSLGIAVLYLFATSIVVLANFAWAVMG